METPGWGGSMIPGEKAEGETSAGYAAEGSNSVEGGADPNYMYGSQPGHNGAGAGDGY